MTKNKEKNMKFHRYADAFHLLKGDEFQKLVERIKIRGLLVPITTFEGKILDGRNRYRACIELGIEPRYTELPEGVDALDFVADINAGRRRDTTGQLAVGAVEIFLPELKELAKKRQKEAGKLYGRGKLDQNSDQAIDEQGRAFKQAADMMGISHQSAYEMNLIINSKWLEKSLRVNKETGEIIVKPARNLRDSVWVDKWSLHRAITELKKRVKLEQLEKIKSLPETKYRIIYADLPWKYGDERTGLKGYTAATEHYPSMTIHELCELPIADLADDDAVLFLWVTSPLLEECFEVIGAWGFKYKSSFIWDKVKNNVGHYNSVRHEFLLICTRGSCVPDTPKLHDSVVSIEKTRKHSEKPEEFRKLIDSMYPHGKRIELFARVEIKGWDSWGAEA